MIIDTERLRGALDRQAETEREDICKGHPPLATATIHPLARLQECRQAAEELVNAVESLAREYIQGESE